MKHRTCALFKAAGLTSLLLFSLAACGGGEPAAGDPRESADATETASNDAAGQSDEFYLGEPRDDLERFFGLYGEPGRQIFVTEAKRPEYAERAPEIPPGYLAIGAMWGDVAPMHMRSLSATTFEHANRIESAPGEPSVAEFEIGPGGDAVSLTFTQGVFADMGRLERAGDLPEKWR